jgi:hypothetical protein
MIDDAYSLVEITGDTTPVEIERIDLPSRITLPTGGTVDFDKAGLTTDSAAERVFKVLPRKLDGDPPTPLHRQAGEPVATYDSENDWMVATRQFELPDNATLAQMAKEKSQSLIWEKIVEKNNGDWTTYKTAVTTRLAQMKAAFLDGGHSIDLDAGTIDGNGGWPV